MIRIDQMRPLAMTLALAWTLGVSHLGAQEVSPASGERDTVVLDAQTLAALGIWSNATPSPAPPPKVDAGGFSWTHGPIRYDNSGNIGSIGVQAFYYDLNSRLVASTLARPDQTGTLTQSYEYDSFGNVIERTTGSVLQSSPADPATNHLATAYAEYNVAGHLERWQSPVSAIYRATFDAAGMVSRLDVENVLGAGPLLYVYTASDQRIWSYDAAANISHWKVRDLDGKVLRDFIDNWNTPATPWSVSRDYFYRNGALLAAATSTATLHFSLDHLGSPRVITDDAGIRIGFHHYLPFGEEWLDGSGPQEGEVLKFTGHERDRDPAGGVADLDYMHARYYSSTWGRFLSIDPKLDEKRTIPSPETWNRYSYAGNNPADRIDPDGQDWYSVLQQGMGGVGRTEHEAIVWIDPRGFGTTYERPAGAMNSEYVGPYSGSYAFKNPGPKGRGILVATMFRNLGPTFNPEDARQNTSIGASKLYDTGRLQCSTYVALLVGDEVSMSYGLGYLIPNNSHPDLLDRLNSNLYVPGVLIGDTIWPADMAAGVGGAYTEVVAPKPSSILDKFMGGIFHGPFVWLHCVDKACF